MKQAVLLIHGIGDQKPMKTLRGFVETVLTKQKGDKPEFWNKPQRVNDLYELRRYSTESRDITKTDFYELYWAHHMKGTNWGHVFPWLGALLFTHPKKLTNKIQPLWVLSWLIILVGVWFIISYFLPFGDSVNEQNEYYKFLYSGGSAVALYLVNRIALYFIGDAARYLTPSPSNVEVRQKIRLAGVQVLNELHKSGNDYDRIIVVGHSLGSVIGYDILTHAWVQYNAMHKAKPITVKQDLLKDFPKRGDKLPERKFDFQDKQRALWVEQRNHGSEWLVTDFITMGSPLAHAQFLLADDKEDLYRRIEEKELPSCPPIADTKTGKPYYVRDYEIDGQRREIKVLHHAALFAVTRWTNLYFPGDFVGGALKEQFGDGILDFRVTLPNKFLTYLPTSHSKYWDNHFVKKGVKGSMISPHVLRNSLFLNSRGWLSEVIKSKK